MSLIQEALQRKQEEPDQPKSSLRLAPPPTPVEPAPAPPAPRPGRSIFLILVLVVLLVILAVSAFLLLRHLYFQKSDSKPQAPETAVVATPPTPTSDSAPTKPELKKQEATPSPAAAESKPTETAPPSTFPGETLPPSPSSAPPAVDTAPSAPSPSPPEPAAVPSEPHWPMLTLKAVMARTGSKRGAALLNGRMVSAGEEIDGVRVLEVRDGGVLLGLEGQTRFLRVGQTLP